MNDDPTAADTSDLLRECQARGYRAVVLRQAAALRAAEAELATAQQERQRALQSEHDMSMALAITQTELAAARTAYLGGDWTSLERALGINTLDSKPGDRLIDPKTGADVGPASVSPPGSGEAPAP